MEHRDRRRGDGRRVRSDATAAPLGHHDGRDRRVRRVRRRVGVGGPRRRDGRRRAAGARVADAPGGPPRRSGGPRPCCSSPTRDSSRTPASSCRRSRRRDSSRGRRRSPRGSSDAVAGTSRGGWPRAWASRSRPRRPPCRSSSSPSGASPCSRHSSTWRSSRSWRRRWRSGCSRWPAAVSSLAGAPTIVGAVLAMPGWIALRIMVAIVDATAALPFASVTLPPPVAAGRWRVATVVGVGGDRPATAASGRGRERTPDAPADRPASASRPGRPVPGRAAPPGRSRSWPARS